MTKSHKKACHCKNCCVPATEAQQYIKHLHKNKIGLYHISRETGINTKNLNNIKTGKQKNVTKKTEQKILNVLTSSRRDYQYVPAEYSQSLIEEMLAAGYTQSQINKALGRKTLGEKTITGKYVRYWRQQQIENLHLLLLRRPPRVSKPMSSRGIAERNKIRQAGLLS